MKNCDKKRDDPPNITTTKTFLLTRPKVQLFDKTKWIVDLFLEGEGAVIKIFGRTCFSEQAKNYLRSFFQIMRNPE